MVVSAAAGASTSAAGDESLDFLVAVLKEVPGVTGVKDFGTEGGSGQYGISLCVRPAEGEEKKRMRVARSSAAIPAGR